MNGKMFGVNIATGTFGQSNDSGTLPGILNTTYKYSVNPLEYQYYASKGLNLFRLGFMWERVQPKALGSLSMIDIAGIKAMLDQVQAVGGKAILDMHNYGRFYNVPLVVGDETLANVWSQLVSEFMNHPALFAYELMNEPHDLSGDGSTWASIAQTVVDAIREKDKNTYIIVGGYNWQHGDNWEASNPTFPLADSVNRIYYACHTYFDGDESGGYWFGTPSDSVGTGRITGSGNFIDWLQKNNQLGIATEYGIPYGLSATTPLKTEWFPVLDDFLNTLNTSPHIVGGTAWAGGEWWGNYNLTIEPYDAPISFTKDRESMTIYQKYPSTLMDSTSTSTSIPVSTSTPISVPMPTPTPSPQPDLSSVSLDITSLNSLIADGSVILKKVRSLLNV